MSCHQQIIGQFTFWGHPAYISKVFRQHGANAAEAAPPKDKRNSYRFVDSSSPVKALRRWLQLRFNCDSTVLRPFDDLRYDRRHCGLGKQIGHVTAASVSADTGVLRRCDLNDLIRTAVESKSN